LKELQREDPRCSSDKKAEKNYEDKFNSKCLRLPHNVLQDLKNLPETLPKILVDPNALSWLDLSHNELSTIDPVR
jgi:Leucine-rich repeat (LRR) protein